jgi:hypothetical protein
MAELAFLSAIITAITTFGKMIYDEIKKAQEDAHAKIRETHDTIMLVVSGESCGPRPGFRTQSDEGQMPGIL